MKKLLLISTIFVVLTACNDSNNVEKDPIKHENVSTIISTDTNKCFDPNEYTKKCNYHESIEFVIEDWMYPQDAYSISHKTGNNAIAMDSTDYCRIYMDTTGRPGDDEVLYFYSAFRHSSHYLAFTIIHTTMNHNIMLNLVTVDSCGILIDEFQLAYDAEGTAMGGDSHSYGKFLNDTIYMRIDTQYGYPPDYIDKIDTIITTIKINDWGKIESDITNGE